MAYKGINFRATSGYDTDDAGYTYSLGEATPVTRGGYTFGWSTNLTASSRDRGTSYEPEQSGIVFQNNSGGTLRDFTWTLPDGAGNYNLRIAAGDYTASQNTRILIMDGGSTLATINGATSAAEFLDAQGTVHTAANWNANNVAVPITFAGTTLTLRLGGHSSATLASVISSVALEFTGGGDTTAPVLTSATADVTGQTTATVGCTTDEANGTQYVVVTTSATQPSIAQIIAGQDHTGSAAVFAGNGVISSTGAHTANATGLTAATAYYAHFVHRDAASNDSNQLSTTQFTTLPNAPTAPTIGATSSIGTTGATINWTDNSSNEASFQVQVESPSGAGNWANASTGASNPTAADAVSLVINGLTSSTEYRPRVRASNTGGDSAWSTGTAFTTSAGGGGSTLLPKLMAMLH